MSVNFCFKLISLFLIIELFGCQQDNGKNFEILIENVSASPVNILHFDIPKDAANKHYFLINKQDEKIPVQVQNNGKALAVLTGIQASREKSFSLQQGQFNGEEIKIYRSNNSVSFSIGGKEILSFRTKAELPRTDIDSVYLRAGFIHPVYTPAGKIITDSYAKNHLHHHGIWTAWTKTEFEGRSPDFWNMAEKTGTVELVSLDSTWAGPVSGGFKATLQYVDLTAADRIKVLNETWEVNIFNTREINKNYSIFDLNIEQENISSSPLMLPEYHYGGLGFRGHESWNGEENTTFLTSEGKDRKDGHATKVRWCHIGGSLEGGQAGITIMNHPENFRAPQPIRIHPSEPFFCYAPSQGGDWAIEPGEVYKARYRFIVYDGEPDIEFIENMWSDYDQPLKVELKNKN